jgi:hypothetical protein
MPPEYERSGGRIRFVAQQSTPRERSYRSVGDQPAVALEFLNPGKCQWSEGAIQNEWRLC